MSFARAQPLPARFPVCRGVPFHQCVQIEDAPVLIARVWAILISVAAAGEVASVSRDGPLFYSMSSFMRTEARSLESPGICSIRAL